MNLSNYQDYLYGTNFSSDLSVEYPAQKRIVQKLEYIKQLVNGKKVIDIGFADHYELIDLRLKYNQWLHQHFRSWTSKIIGIDIDPKAVEYVKNKFNYTDVFCHDITSSEPLHAVLQDKWDYIILSEVLEHIPNPAHFLEAIRKNYGGSVQKIIITVPNAYGIITLRSVFNRKERINSDHKFWFTPYTLAKVIVAAGLQIEEIVPCNSYYPLRWWERLLVKRSPLFHHTLAMVARF